MPDQDSIKKEEAAAETGQQSEASDPEPHDEVSSPTLDHLDGTMKAARAAAEQALAPQRDQNVDRT